MTGPNSKKPLKRLPLAELADALLYYMQTYCLGQENAVVGRELSIAVYKSMGRPVPSDTRQLRRAMNHLIEQGHIVCSASGDENPDLVGYWLATSIEDAQPAIAELASRRIELIEREKKLRANLAAKFPPEVVQLGLGFEVEAGRKPVRVF